MILFYLATFMTRLHRLKVGFFFKGFLKFVCLYLLVQLMLPSNSFICTGILSHQMPCAIVKARFCVDVVKVNKWVLLFVITEIRKLVMGYWLLGLPLMYTQLGRVEGPGGLVPLLKGNKARCFQFPIIMFRVSLFTTPWFLIAS